MADSQTLYEAAANSEYGVQEDGEFEAPFLDELLARMEAELGERVPEYDGAPGSPYQQLLEIFALEAEALWESQRSLYYSAFLEDSFGAHLDRLLALAGVSRLTLQGATGEVTFSASNATATRDITIPSGTRVAAPETDSSPRLPFRTREAVTLKEGEATVEEVPIRALTPYETDIDPQYLGSETNVGAGTITKILDPIAGIGGVTNPEPTGTSGTRADGTQYSFRLGRDRETDAELKERYRESLGLGGKATLQAIRAAVLNVDGVGNAAIEENTDEHWVRVTALADTSLGDDIAQAIVDTRSGGIPTKGEYTGTGEVNGQAYEERFDLAGLVTISVNVNLDVTEEFPDDGESQIKDAIISYIGGETTRGEHRTGLDIGIDVPWYKVASACDITGVYDATVTLGTSSTSYAEGEDVPISDTQVAETGSSSIDITTTTITPP